MLYSNSKLGVAHYVSLMMGVLISCDAVSFSFGRLARRVYVKFATGTVRASLIPLVFMRVVLFLVLQ